MDYGEYLTSSRWQILEVIAREPASPSQIAKTIGTSVAYVSQQIKLLEATGLVIKRKTGDVSAGKPRLVYSIRKDLAAITILIKMQPMKISINPSKIQKTIMMIWSLEESKLHYPLEKLFWKLEPNLDEIDGIFLKEDNELVVVSKSKKIENIISENIDRKILKKFKIHSDFDFSKTNSELIKILYLKEGLEVRNAK